MKLSDIRPNHYTTQLAPNDLADLQRFYDVLIEKLKLERRSFFPGTLGESFSNKHGRIKLSITMSGKFLRETDMFMVKMIAKLVPRLVAEHLPEWELMNVNMYNKGSKGSRVGHFDIGEYVEEMSQHFDIIPKDTEIGVFLKAPAKYQVRAKKSK